MRLNDNQQEIYDIIMNDECCYNCFMKDSPNLAIEVAEGLSDDYGNPSYLTDDEKEELKEYIKSEYEENKE